MDKDAKTGQRYSPEEKAAAVRMVRTLRVELGTDRETAQRVALQLGYGWSLLGPGSDGQTLTAALQKVSPQTGRPRFDVWSRKTVS